jgi:hypothetical protein
MTLISSSKLIFLDFDGVVNSVAFIKKLQETNSPLLEDCSKLIDYSAVQVLNKIIERTGAKVVISSTWRLYFKRNKLIDILESYGFKGIVIGVTPDLINKPRGEEIQRWMDNCEYQGKFVIIDDSSDMAHLKDHLFQTDNDYGLLEEHIEPIVERLNK